MRALKMFLNKPNPSRLFAGRGFQTKRSGAAGGYLLRRPQYPCVIKKYFDGLVLNNDDHLRKNRSVKNGNRSGVHAPEPRWPNPGFPFVKMNGRVSGNRSHVCAGNPQRLPDNQENAIIK
jgi:hypothetical protein